MIIVLLNPGRRIGKIFTEWLTPISRRPTAYVIQYALGIILSSQICHSILKSLSFGLPKSPLD